MNRFCLLVLFLKVLILEAGLARFDPASQGAMLLHYEAAYECPDVVSTEVWEKVKPYLLPIDMGLKDKLDRIFGAARATADRNSLLQAGFVLAEDQGQHVVAAFHKDLKGYLVKVIFDKNNTKRDKVDWKQWLKRVEGEKVIRQAINELGYKKYFKVPKQWIYPLPAGPKCPDLEGYQAKGFILIAEDMRLESKSNNTKYYRNIGKKTLDAIYIITTKYGLSDCCNKHNLPVCKDGKLAFVDTETYYNWPVDYHRIVEHLSESGRSYWKTLRSQDGPKTR